MQLTTAIVLKTASTQMLGALAGVLKKGADHAAAHKIPEEVLLNARLYPDMFPTVRQVQIACDQITRGSARMGGLDLPSFPDTETSFTELYARIHKADTYCRSVDSALIDSRTNTEITIPIGGGNEKTMTCGNFLVTFILPNLYFHASTAYDILRHNGVPLTKADFLRPE